MIAMTGTRVIVWPQLVESFVFFFFVIPSYIRSFTRFVQRTGCGFKQTKKLLSQMLQLLVCCIQIDGKTWCKQ